MFCRRCNLILTKSILASEAFDAEEIVEAALKNQFFRLRLCERDGKKILNQLPVFVAGQCHRSRNAWFPIRIPSHRSAGEPQ